jgi:hypothetical protein
VRAPFGYPAVRYVSEAVTGMLPIVNLKNSISLKTTVQAIAVAAAPLAPAGSSRKSSTSTWIVP